MNFPHVSNMSFILKSKNSFSHSGGNVDTFVTNKFTTLCQLETTMKYFVYLHLYIERFNLGNTL